MENGGEEAVLSDIEAEDHDGPSVNTSHGDNVVNIDSYNDILAAFERERRERQAAEAAKNDLQTSFNRLKVLAHEAIKKRDEATREKEEALRSNENLSSQLSDALRLKDEALKQRKVVSQEVEEAIKARDAFKSEIDSSSQLLARGIEKISGKIVEFKNFNDGLPRSSKFTGLPGLAYGVIRRTNDIVDELLKQHETVKKASNDIREQMEQRNYEIAIEISDLEARISTMKEDLEKRSCQVENLAKLIAERDEKISKMEREFSEQLRVSECKARELDIKSKNFENKFDLQKPLIADQLGSVSRVHNQLCGVIKVINAGKLDQDDVTESMFLPSDLDMEENLRTSLVGIATIEDLAKRIMDRVKNEMEANTNNVEVLSNTISQLQYEKQCIAAMLRHALSAKIPSDSSMTGSISQYTEKSVSNAIPNDLTENRERVSVDGEIHMLVCSLEEVVKASQVEIIELHQLMKTLRTESSNLKVHLEAQAKEISQYKQYIKELESKERIAKENVASLMVDVSSAEEEIARWKMAAEQEAAAGRAVEQEYQIQISSFRNDVDETRQVILELENKVKFKEETAAAAMAARDAAEKSLKLADLRASGLGKRVEELSRQLEAAESRHDFGAQGRHRYACWPWQWLGLTYVGGQAETQQDPSEMELSEPLL